MKCPKSKIFILLILALFIVSCDRGNKKVDEFRLTSTSKNKMRSPSIVGKTSFMVGGNVISSYNNFNPTENRLYNFDILSFKVDDEKVNFLGTSKGVSIFKDNKCIDFWGRKREEILLEYKITSIVSGNDGWGYCLNNADRVSRFKYRDPITRSITNTHPWSYGLKSVTVFSVFVDQDSHYWFGTNRCLDFNSNPNTKSNLTSYSSEDGFIYDSVLTNNKIYLCKLR